MPSTEPLAFLAGQILPQSQAHLTLHDAGFVMGATVTDLCRTFHGRLYRWQDHLERFGRSCQKASLSAGFSESEITARAEELVNHNLHILGPGAELALVMFATPGPIGYYLGEPGGAGDGPGTFGMHTFPLPWERYRRWVEQGVSLVVPSIQQIPGESVDPHIKHRSRMHWWLADREAGRVEPGSLALLLDADGCVTETAAANFLIVRGGTVFSPPRQNILHGVSLTVVRELCHDLAIPFVERPLTIDDCLSADEAMLASTPYCLVGVSRIQGRAIGFPGAILRRLLGRWSEIVGVDIHRQIATGTP